MQGIFRAGLVAIGLMLVFCQGAAAFNVTELTVDPSGAVTEGTPVIIKGIIAFTPSSDVTFKDSHELQFSTDLEKAKWTYSLVLDGVDNPQPSSQGNQFTVSGWILSYPKTADESIKVTVEGVAPSVNQTMNKTLIRIQEVDEKGSVVTESLFMRDGTVVDPQLCCSRQQLIGTDLQNLRDDINEKAAIGVNTSAAETKYSNATQNIATAKALPSTRYAEAYWLLESAQNDIDDGERLLDKAWAEKEVADAQERIDLVDARILLLKSESGTANSPMLGAINTRRDIAVQYLADAHAKIAAGNYSQARDKAEKTQDKANESYTDSFNVREHSLWEDWFALPPPCKCGGIFSILYLVFVVAITGIKIAIPIVAILGVYYLIRKWKGAKPE